MNVFDFAAADISSVLLDIVGKVHCLILEVATEPEVPAAGHDRTIINIKPEHVDAWLNPNPADLDALYAIFDDKRHPFYEHRLAA
ncbi:hypothetical protein [Stenotrophomonas sp. RG-453]|uniref:hypothetical protein n=1 Tax=Stenotrophomonas sp. RG-453 TaxID=2957502 RepID=UPI0029CA92AF|nr:hypothetical protein [Stenotrophomonas sp. RG-453]MDX5515832.1 hypothetical protein [Stenotrophomonas sp. RG-453]